MSPLSTTCMKWTIEMAWRRKEISLLAQEWAGWGNLTDWLLLSYLKSEV